MPTIQEAIKHPAFKTLPPEEQKKVFSRLSPEYNGLPPEEQDKVISRFSPMPVLPQSQIPSRVQGLFHRIPYKLEEAIYISDTIPEPLS